MTSAKTFRILAALAGISGQIALGIYYSGVLVPAALNPGSATTSQLMSLAVTYHDAIFADAWLQAVGALNSVIFFVALVQMAKATDRFAGWMTILGSAILLAVALGDATFVVAAANAASIGHAQTAQVAFDLVAGAGEAFDYAFLFVPAPLVIISLGAVLLGSDILPRVLGYLAILLGVVFVGLGVVSLASPLSGWTGTVFEAAQLVQVSWIMASGVLVISRA